MWNRHYPVVSCKAKWSNMLEEKDYKTQRVKKVLQMSVQKHKKMKMI